MVKVLVAQNYFASALNELRLSEEAADDLFADVRADGLGVVSIVDVDQVLTERGLDRLLLLGVGLLLHEVDDRLARVVLA